MNHLIKTLCFIFALAGCHQLWPPSSKDPCLLACQQQQLRCHKLCLTDCPHCCKYTKMQGTVFYRRYLRRSRIEGKPAFSSLQSFYDPLQCNKNSCDCVQDFLLCEQNCQGKIHKRLKTYKFC